MAEYDSHAVVLGAGIAGLLAARVLSDSYRTVTVVERDVLAGDLEPRTGVPQGRHLHNFLAQGHPDTGRAVPRHSERVGCRGSDRRRR